jgi:DNA-directed RNA polymerase sigma subunit (sigma70/sigma32)
MAGSFEWIGDEDESWPSDEGWPYPDRNDARTDEVAELDDDLMTLHAAAPHLFDDLAPVERQVIRARFGLDGHPARTLRQVQSELGLGHDDVRVAFADGLAKLRRHLR